MKKFLFLVVAVIIAACPLYAALIDDHSTNYDQDQDQLQGQHQGQGQLQGQEQGQGQHQGQLAVSAQGQLQGQEASNEGNSQNINYSYDQERYVNPVALGFDTPEGNDGLVAQTPWGSGAITVQSELTQLGIVADIYSKAGKEIPSVVLDQALEASTPCRFLGVGPKRFSPIGGFLCWKGLRK